MIKVCVRKVLCRYPYICLNECKVFKKKNLQYYIYKFINRNNEMKEDVI